MTHVLLQGWGRFPQSHQQMRPYIVLATVFGVWIDFGWGFARSPLRKSPIWQLEVTGGSSSPAPSSSSRLDRLTDSLDKYILTGAPATRKTALDILQEIENIDGNEEEITIARRRMQRAGFMSDPRHQIAEERKRWEQGRSILSERQKRTPSDELVKSTMQSEGLLNSTEESSPRVQTLANSKKALQDELESSHSLLLETLETSSTYSDDPMDVTELVAELVAKAGASFDGDTLGVGGLDEVLTEVKRRVWIPLAAPPQLLKELGIRPIRGLLLYGKPGCGKTLVAQKLGRILSPLRPVSIVSGPEIMDKFVGSSEKNLRAIFDNPPDVYQAVKSLPNGDAIAKAALHIIIMDEFDAIARHRGGRGGAGDQGDAGVARDSVVNQLLAKMDGAAPLEVPTLIIGMTNKRSLIDTALLRPGRFEVHIEVPPPTTVEQRVSILKVHTKHMQNAGRLYVSDAPVGSPGAAYKSSTPAEHSYLELLTAIARESDGFSGASLAAVARSAASYALERTVEGFSHQLTGRPGHTMLHDCVVTFDDLTKALEDVRNVGEADHNETEEDETENSLPNEAKSDIA